MVTHFFLEKAEKRLDEIKETIYRQELPVKEYLVQEGKEPGPEAMDYDDSQWRHFTTDELWGGYNQYQWFRTILHIPEMWAGKTVAFYLDTSTNIEWKRSSEYTVYLNGELVQGLDFFHHELLLTTKAVGGETYQLAMMGFSGLYDDLSHTVSKLVVIDHNAEDLYYDLKVAYDGLKDLEPDTETYIAVEEVINETLKKIDFRKPKSELYYNSLAEAKEYIRENLYEKMHSTSNAKINAIGHTHIDVAWLWQLSHTREKAGRSFSTACRLMDQYPDYKFFLSQPQLYEYTKKKYPELYKKIKEKVKEGRWEPEGGMWVEADCNLISGESMVRQFLVGKKFFKEEFGVDSKILWLPDVFGYSAAMPQILKKCGIKYFMTTKISWNQFNNMPMDTFWFQGIDGTKVLTHFMTTPELRKSNMQDEMQTLRFKKTYNGIMCAKAVHDSWKNYRNKNGNQELVMAFGWGDGGGGPTKEMLENAKRLKDFPGHPKAEIGFVRPYFERLEETVKKSDKIPTWVGELYLETHRGTYTSMARNKRMNRRAEFLYLNAETFSVFNHLLGGEYPKEKLDENWKVILLNQFHDIIPGSSIEAVYEDSKIQYEHLLHDGQEMYQDALCGLVKHIDVREDGWVVFNPTSCVDSNLVTVESSEEIEGLKDPNGNISPVQKIGENRYLFYANGVPSKGYKVFYPSNTMEAKGLLRASLEGEGYLLENDYFRICVDKTGAMTEIYDKRARRQVLKAGERGNVIRAFEDKPVKFNAWDIDIYYTEKMWEVNETTSIELVENGNVRLVLRVQKKFLDSVISQDIVLYRAIPRIDFETTVDWKEKEILLKTEFPVDVNASKATFEIQYGNLERATHRNTSWDEAKFEVCAHKWMDISETDYGVSVLNDCKYGCDVLGTTMRLTLLKSGIHPNPHADNEVHHFTYSLYPHEKDWRQGGTVSMAYALNNGFEAVPAIAEGGSLPEELSMMAVDVPNVIIESVKRAENEDSVIVRLYETDNSRADVVLNIFKKASGAWECNMLEEEEREVICKGNQIQFSMKPFEIKTLKVKF